MKKAKTNVLNNSDISFYELSFKPEDIALLEQFYNAIYVQEFPEENERESLENMKNCLMLKAQGWYDFNNYHILLLFEGLMPIGCSVTDYLSEPNAGIIEFIVISKSLRNKGIGRKLLGYTEKMLFEDAQRYTGRPLDWIVAELHDPFESRGNRDSMDSFERTLLWHKWGYKKISFPYIQPALSRGKDPVNSLLLITKTFSKDYKNMVPSAKIMLLLKSYLKWAMRIDVPENNLEYVRMKDYLGNKSAVELTSLSEYIGENEVAPLIIQELISLDTNDKEAALAIYNNAFSRVETAIPVDRFQEVLYSASEHEQLFSYHFWAIRSSQDKLIRGIASFFTFPVAGFGGYIAFDMGMRGRGRLSEVLARIERQMIYDNKGTRGWFIECDPRDNSTNIFLRKGFYETALNYYQPNIVDWQSQPMSDCQVLQLLYKDFGECLEPPELSVQEFLIALEWFFRVVYKIDDPKGSIFFQHVEDQIIKDGSDFIQWRIK